MPAPSGDSATFAYPGLVALGGLAGQRPQDDLVDKQAEVRASHILIGTENATTPEAKAEKLKKATYKTTYNGIGTLPNKGTYGLS